MNLEQVTKLAEECGVPEGHITRIRERLQEEADMSVPLKVYKGPGKGVTTGRHYASCFDVTFVRKTASGLTRPVGSYDWILWQI